MYPLTLFTHELPKDSGNGEHRLAKTPSFQAINDQMMAIADRVVELDAERAALRAARRREPD